MIRPRRSPWLLGMVAACSAACATKDARFLAAEVIDVSTVVQDIDILPDRGYVIRADPAVQKIIRIEFVRPVVRSSIALGGITVEGQSVDGFDPGPVDISSVHFDDDPGDLDPGGGPVLSIGIDLDDADVVPGGHYVLTFDQPALLFADDPVTKAVAFDYPPFKASAAPDAEWPFVADLSPGPIPDVPGWGAPVALSDLPVMGDPASFSGPTFAFTPPHAELVVDFSEDMAQFALVVDPLDPAVRLDPIALTEDVPPPHPVPFRQLRGRTAQGMLPAQDYSLTFLSRDRVGLVPLAFGTQDVSGRFLGLHAAPDLIAFLGGETDHPLDIEFRFGTSHVRIESPRIFADRPLGLGDLVNGEIPLEIVLAPDVDRGTVAVSFTLSEGPFPFVVGGFGGRVTSVTSEQITQAGVTKDVQRVVTSHPRPFFPFVGVLEITVSVVDGSSASLGFDRIDVAADFDPPEIEVTSESVTDDDLDDGSLDLFCVTADEPLSSVTISGPSESIQLETATAASTTILADGRIQYCFEDVPLPSGLGTDGGPYSITVTGADEANNPSEPQVVSISCHVPATMVREDSGDLHGGVVVYQDVDDRTHVLNLLRRSGASSDTLREHFERDGRWLLEGSGTRFTTPDGQKVAGPWDAVAAPDGTVHVCLPLRNSSSDTPLSNRDLLYLTRKEPGTAWHVEEVVAETGPYECSIAYDPYAPSGAGPILIAFAQDDPETGMAVPRLARRHRDLTGTTFGFDIENMAACPPRTLGPPGVPAFWACGDDIDVTTAPDGTVHATYGTYSFLPLLVYAVRDPQTGEWTSERVSTPHDAGGDPELRDFGKNMQIFLRAGRVEIYGIFLLSLGDTRKLVRLSRSLDADPGVDWDRDVLTQPINMLDNILGLSHDAFAHANWGIRFAVAFDELGRHRILYADAGRSGVNAELRLVYEEHCCSPENESVIASNLVMQGDYGAAINRLGRVRGAFYTRHAADFSNADDLLYFQEENAIELRRGVAVPPSGSCAADAFATMCSGTGVGANDVLLAPEPLPLPVMEILDPDLDAKLDEAKAILGPIYPEVPLFVWDLLAPPLSRFLSRQALQPINAFRWDNRIEDEIASRDGGTEVSYIADVFRGLVFRAGRVPLKMQPAVCVPLSDLPPDHDICDQPFFVPGAPPPPVGHLDMDLTVEFDDLTEAFASASDAAKTAIDSAPELFACIGDPTSVALQNPDLTHTCASCSMGTYSPAHDQCVICPLGTMPVLDYADPVVLPATANQQVVCVAPGCDTVTDEERREGFQDWSRLPSGRECARCPAGAMAKVCLGNETGNEICLDPVEGRGGYACATSGFCERIRECSVDAECGAVNCGASDEPVCQDGQCQCATTCTEDEDCGDRNSCDSGHCDKQFNQTRFETIPGDFLCDPIGCSACWKNRYCDPDIEPRGGCPIGHRCTGFDEEVLTPACILRPTLNDVDLQFVLSRLGSAGQGFGDITGPIQIALAQPMPLRISKVLDEDAVFTVEHIDLQIDHVEVQTRASIPEGLTSVATRQGVIEIDVFFVDDRIAAFGEGEGELDVGPISVSCSGDFTARTDGPATFRMFLEPFVDYRPPPLLCETEGDCPAADTCVRGACRRVCAASADCLRGDACIDGVCERQFTDAGIGFTLVAADMVQDVETGESAQFTIEGADCNGDCVETCQVFDASQRDLVRKEIVGQIATRLNDSVLQAVRSLYGNLVLNRSFGLLLFNVQTSCNEAARVAAIETVRVNEGEVETVYRSIGDGTLYPACSIPDHPNVTPLCPALDTP